MLVVSLPAPRPQGQVLGKKSSAYKKVGTTGAKFLNSVLLAASGVVRHAKGRAAVLLMPRLFP